jgi:hypothetical protein
VGDDIDGDMFFFQMAVGRPQHEKGTEDEQCHFKAPDGRIFEKIGPQRTVYDHPNQR